MFVSSVRPDASELVFRLYDRSIHPELLSVYAEQSVTTEFGLMTIRICDSGHVVSVRAGSHELTEVATGRDQPLPQKKCCLSRRLNGQRDTSHQFPSGLTYQASFQLEVLEPDVFLNLHEELSLDCRKASLAWQFPSQSRLAPRPISIVQSDAARDSLLIHAFHTFPENCAVVKTQSLFELPVR